MVFQGKRTFETQPNVNGNTIPNMKLNLLL